MIGQAFEETRGKYETPQRESFAREMDYVKPERAGYVGKEPEVPKNVVYELGALRENVAKAHELLSVLENRLEPIRRPAPQCNEKDVTPNRIGSELREAMAEENVKLRALVGRISYLIDEIDL